MKMAIEFYITGVNDKGETVYTFKDNGVTVKEKLTIDEVMEILNKRDEESLGARHAPKAI